MAFQNAEHMLESIRSQNDYYNPKTGAYIHPCDIYGSCRVYHIREAEMRRLLKTAGTANLASLAPLLRGTGAFYPSETAKFRAASEPRPTAQDYCMDTYRDPEWISLEDYRKKHIR